MSTTVDLAVPSDPTRAVPADPTRAVPADLASARSLHQRLNAALDDLGLSEALPPRWATPARSGFFFAPHNLGQAGRLVDALEHLGEVLSDANIEVHPRLSVEDPHDPSAGHPGADRLLHE